MRHAKDNLKYILGGLAAVPPQMKLKTMNDVKRAHAFAGTFHFVIFTKYINGEYWVWRIR